MLRPYRKPMYARVLGWAANWSPKKGSLTEAIWEDVKFWGFVGAKMLDSVILKLQSNKNRENDEEDIDE